MSDYLYSCQNVQQHAEVRNINHFIFLSVKFTQQFHKSVINVHILDFEDGRFRTCLSHLLAVCTINYVLIQQSAECKL